MKTFREVAQSLNAEYSLRTRELRVFREGRLVVRSTIPQNDSDDFWHGDIIDEIDVDFNLYKSEEEVRPTYSLCVYPVYNRGVDTSEETSVPLVVLNTYWCVSTTIGDKGHVVCNLIGAREHEEKPEQSFHHFSHVDRYIDFFDSEQEALELVAQAKKA